MKIETRRQARCWMLHDRCRHVLLGFCPYVYKIQVHSVLLHILCCVKSSQHHFKPPACVTITAHGAISITQLSCAFQASKCPFSQVIFQQMSEWSCFDESRLSLGVLISAQASKPGVLVLYLSKSSLHDSDITSFRSSHISLFSCLDSPR